MAEEFLLVDFLFKNLFYYEEVAGSGAIAGGILKGINMGIHDETHHDCAERAMNAICKNTGADGTILNDSAETGMGYDADHYKTIIIRPMACGQSLDDFAFRSIEINI